MKKRFIAFILVCTFVVGAYSARSYTIGGHLRRLGAYLQFWWKGSVEAQLDKLIASMQTWDTNKQKLSKVKNIIKLIQQIKLLDTKNKYYNKFFKQHILTYHFAFAPVKNEGNYYFKCAYIYGPYAYGDVRSLCKLLSLETVPVMYELSLEELRDNGYPVTRNYFRKTFNLQGLGLTSLKGYESFFFDFPAQLRNEQMSTVDFRDNRLGFKYKDSLEQDEVARFLTGKGVREALFDFPLAEDRSNS